MKSKIYITIIFIMALSMLSCEDFLTTNLRGEYTTESFYNSAENATMSVNAIYNSLYGNTLWIFGDVASDDAVKGGNAGDQADINAINDFSAKSDNGVLNTFWQSTYETISRANNAITNIPGIEMDDALKNRLLGEAKFLRAYSYFNLVNIFGKVPLKLEPQNKTATIYIELSDENKIYAQIEQDLTDAVAALPDAYPAEKGRVTKGAAYALLAKAQLYQKKYAECLTSIQSLEGLNQYALLDNYADLFQSGAEDSVEVIFGLRYLNNTEVSLGNHLNVWFAPSIEGGYYFNAPTQSYVDAFTERTVDDKEDPRLDASIGRNGKPWFNNRTFSASWSEATGYLVRKYNEDMVPELAKSQSTIPYHAIRYADVLLMKAEAINEAGGAGAVTNAAKEVDKVRLRAGLAATTAATQVNLREVIRNERRKELGFEFHRFFDLMRWGKETAEAALGSDFQWKDPRFYFPIPQSELDTNQALQ
ncbi:MAG TPA: RagB/SusD family nutrient uptake outer membrane protein [Paludibacter sp.]|nr:RagB/SusD family nutrient uptake outer membrane protein [Paludibacter sp.]